MNRLSWYRALVISCSFTLSAIGAEQSAGGWFSSWFTRESEPQRIGKQLVEAINADLHKIDVILKGRLMPGASIPVRPRPELYKQDSSLFANRYKELASKYRVLPTWKVEAYTDAYTRFINEYVSTGDVTEESSRLHQSFERSARQLLESVTSLYNL